MIKGRILLIVAMVGLSFGAMVSCAEKSPDVTVGMADESLAAWVKRYAPQAQQIEDGVYMEFMERASSWQELAAVKLDTSWIRLNMTSRALDQSVVGTRDSTVARLVGSWSYTTHFSPDMLLYTAYSYSPLCPGLIRALGYMRAGDKVRVYIPALMARGTSTFGSGYAVMSNYVEFPVYYDVELVEVINDPVEWEIEMVNKYVADKWGYSVADTIAKGLYMRKTVTNPTGDTITRDSTVRLYQVLRFLDGQLLSTNIDSVARAEHYMDVKPQTNTDYSVLTINKVGFENEYKNSKKVYPKILTLMRTGETAEVVATSSWGLGYYGAVSNVPQIGAFESTRYQFRTLLRTDNIDE